MFSRQQSPRAGAVFNDESTARDTLTKLRSKQACHDVIGTTCGEAHHNAHLSRGPGLRMGTARQHANKRGRSQQSAAAMNARHGLVSSVLFLVVKAKPARTRSASLKRKA
jgi:hypothetical protein